MKNVRLSTQDLPLNHCVLQLLCLSPVDEPLHLFSPVHQIRASLLLEFLLQHLQLLLLIVCLCVVESSVTNYFIQALHVLFIPTSTVLNGVSTFLLHDSCLHQRVSFLSLAIVLLETVHEALMLHVQLVLLSVTFHTLLMHLHSQNASQLLFLLLLIMPLFH